MAPMLIYGVITGIVIGSPAWLSAGAAELPGDGAFRKGSGMR